MAARRTWQVFIMLGGLLAWAVQFTILYGVTSTVCAREWADATLLGIGIVPATVAVTTLAAFAATAVILLYSLRTYRRLEAEAPSASDLFLNQAAILISAYSLAAILWHGLPAFILPACA